MPLRSPCLTTRPSRSLGRESPRHKGLKRRQGHRKRKGHPSCRLLAPLAESCPGTERALGAGVKTANFCWGEGTISQPGSSLEAGRAALGSPRPVEQSSCAARKELRWFFKTFLHADWTLDKVSFPPQPASVPSPAEPLCCDWTLSLGCRAALSSSCPWLAGAPYKCPVACTPPPSTLAPELPPRPALPVPGMQKAQGS